MAIDVSKGISHLEHLEDFVIIAGKQGVNQAVDTINKYINKFSAEGSDELVISEKIDGCIHPDTEIKTTEEDKESTWVK